MISIHALREEGDYRISAFYQHPQDFYPRPPRGGRPGDRRAGRLKCISIHALREEGDYVHNQFVQHCIQFLSTPSARRATAADWRTMNRTVFLSTPSARRATKFKYPKQPDLEISIHALREEGDPYCNRRSNQPY